MKEDVIYFVEDAYGYLVCTDEVGFSNILNIWKDNDCNFKITTKVVNDFTVNTLWRV